MPVITFLVQRIALGVLAAMTFLGLVTEETYFATENSFIVPQERKEAIVDSLLDPETVIVFEELQSEETLDVEPIKIKQITTPEEKTLESELEEIVEQNIPEKKSFFRLPEDFLYKEAEIQGVAIPETLTKKPVPQEKYKAEQEKIVRETLDTIEKRLETLKVEQQEVVPQVVKNVVIPNTLANAVVNIVCLEKNGNTLSIAVGSGVIVSPQGTIITNGHVAQHILKQESEYVDCEVKHPENPTMRYRVAVVHIPEMWRGGKLLSESHGTGEKDFAFLNVVGPAPEGVIPSSFPYLPVQLSSSVLTIGNDILLAGYPAKKTGNVGVDTNVPQVRGNSIIENVFTFQNDSVDVVSSGVSPVAKQGSSGGAVVDNGALIGIIVTTNISPTGGEYLNGLTLNYIQRELKRHGLSIESFI